MGKFNYNEVQNIINAINNDELIKTTKEERKLLSELQLNINIDRYNKILEYIVERDNSINELLRTVNEKLKEHIEGKKFVSPYYDRSTYVIDNLNDVKDDIIKYKREQYTDNRIQENNLIDKCLTALSEKPFRVPYFFDEFIAVKNNSYTSNECYELNKELINKMYKLLSNDILVSEIVTGTRIKKDKEKFENTVGKCEVSLSFKDIVLKNADKIVEFNEIVREIDKVLEEKRSDKYVGLIPRETKVKNMIRFLESNYVRKLVNKSRLERLHAEEKMLLERKKEYQDLDAESIRLHIELSKLNMELKDKGLSDLMQRSDMKYILNSEDDELAITSNLRKFYSTNEIDNYFKNVEKNYYENKGLLEKTKYEEKEFNGHVSKEALKLIETDFDTAVDISRLYSENKRIDIDPKIALFVLKSLTDLKEIELEDMNVTEEEYEKLKDYFDKTNKEKIAEFDKKYIIALEGRNNRWK